MNDLRRDNHQLYEKIFHEGPLGIAVVGLDFRFMEVNEAFCKITGYSSDELKTMKFTDITHPDDILFDTQLADQLFKGTRHNYQIEKRYIKKSGEIVWIHLAGSVIRGSDGSALYGLAMVTDITEQRNKTGQHVVASLFCSDSPNHLSSQLGKIILRVCSWCNKIETRSGFWERFESFLQRKAGLNTSHTVCEDCSKKELKKGLSK